MKRVVIGLLLFLFTCCVICKNDAQFAMESFQIYQSLKALNSLEHLPHIHLRTLDENFCPYFCYVVAYFPWDGMVINSLAKEFEIIQSHWKNETLYSFYFLDLTEPNSHQIIPKLQLQNSIHFNSPQILVYKKGLIHRHFKGIRKAKYLMQFLTRVGQESAFTASYSSETIHFEDNTVEIAKLWDSSLHEEFQAITTIEECTVFSFVNLQRSISYPATLEVFKTVASAYQNKVPFTLFASKNWTEYWEFLNTFSNFNGSIFTPQRNDYAYDVFVYKRDRNNWLRFPSTEEEEEEEEVSTESVIIDKDRFIDFIYENCKALVPELTSLNYEDIISRRKPVAILFISHPNLNQIYLLDPILPIFKMYRNIALEMESQLSFGYMDLKQYYRFAQSLTTDSILQKVLETELFDANGVMYHAMLVLLQPSKTRHFVCEECIVDSTMDFYKTASEFLTQAMTNQYAVAKRSSSMFTQGDLYPSMIPSISLEQLEKHVFVNQLLKDREIAVVFFTSHLCAPCKHLLIELQGTVFEFAQMNQRIHFYNFDTDFNHLPTQVQKIQSIPSIAVFKAVDIDQQNRVVVAQIYNGFWTAKDIRVYLLDILNRG